MDDHSDRVTFVVRSDDFVKPGGDSLQVREYARHLEGLGWAVTIEGFRADLRIRPGHVVHVMNLDRVYDFLLTMRAAQGHPVFVSPIHHSLELTRRMRSDVRQSRIALRIVNSLPEQARELLALCWREIRRDRRSSLVLRTWRILGLLPTSLSPWIRAGRCLNQAAGVFLLAPGEGESLRHDTGWSAGNDYLTPNAVAAIPPSLRPWSERAGIIAVGRIEPRKRILELAEAADRSGIQLRVVGALGTTDRRYARALEELAARSPFVDYVGALPHDRTVEAISHARVLVNASFVEVQSLVDLEGAMTGCHVVSCPSGHTGNWLSADRYHETSSFDVDVVLREAARWHDSQAPGELSKDEYPWTWQETSVVIDRAYRSSADLRT